VPDGFVRLTCPPGSETAPISHDIFGYEAFRERSGDRTSGWLVDVPAEAAVYFCGIGGFKLHDPDAQ
jgi:hypothetical protein